MFVRRYAIRAAVCGLLLPLSISAKAQSADAAILQFQRSADSYAFAVRQEKHQHIVRAPLEEGAMFTPQVAFVLRGRIAVAVRNTHCAIEPTGDFVVPRVNDSAVTTRPLVPCLSTTLPRLPPELEYRIAGVALILADTNRHVVVDILHSAFP